MERLLVINLSCNEWDDIPELGLLALTGYMAIAAHVKPLAAFGNNGAMPGLINTFAAIIVNDTRSVSRLSCPLQSRTRFGMRAVP